MRTVLLVLGLALLVMRAEAAITVSHNGNCYGTLADFAALGTNNVPVTAPCFGVRKLSYNGPIPAASIEAVIAISNIGSFIVMNAFRVSNGEQLVFDLAYEFSEQTHRFNWRKSVGESFTLSIMGNAYAAITINGDRQIYTSSLAHHGTSEVPSDPAGFKPQNFTVELYSGQGGSVQLEGLYSVVNTPEPGTYLMLGSGLAAMFAWKRRSSVARPCSKKVPAKQG